MSYAERTSPEILLLEKLEEVDKALPPALWEQMRADVGMAESLERADKTMLPAVHQRKRMFLRDFVEKAVSMPLKIYPDVPPETERQLYRLHLFCCQRAIHCPEVRRNPFQLGFEALREMKTALTGMMISYRLIDPSCPYSWDRKFFETNIITDKDAEGRTVVKFNRIPPHIVPLAVTEELVTDWLIYRAYDNNGIRTLMDYKNNLLTLPDYQRGGAPESEFSRFERKMQEQRNREEKHKNQELDLEFRKTLVRSVAEQTAARMLNTGLSDLEILNQAYNADLNTLVDNRPSAARYAAHSLPGTAHNHFDAAHSLPDTACSHFDAAQTLPSRSANPARELPPQPEFSTALSSNYRHSPDCLSALSQYSTAPIAAEPASAPQALPAPYPSSASCQTQPAPASQPQQPAGASRKKQAPKTPQSSIMDEVIARFLEE